jgi:hypothetical protein
MIRITTIAEQHNFNCARLKYQLRRNGVPLVRSQKVLFLKDQDLLRCQMLIARLKLSDAQPRTPEQLRAIEYQRKRYENEVREKQGLEPIPIVRGRPKLTGEKLGNYSRPLIEKAPEPVLEVVFDYKGIVKKGIVIGGLDRRDVKTAMVRFKHQGFEMHAEPKYSEILNKTESEVAEMVRIAKIKRKE